MRAAVQLGTKSQLLSKLHAAPKSCKLQFVYDGGLEILEEWIRKDPPLRKGSLVVLKDLPVTRADLKKAKLREALETLGREGDSEEPDELLAQWQAQGLFSVSARSKAPPGPVPVDDIGSIDPELRQLHPRIAEFLASRPLLLQFLKAQPGDFLRNLSSRSVALLVRLETARLGSPPAAAAAAAAAPEAATKANRANRTVQVTGLGEDAEDDVEWLLQKLREVGLQECKQTGVELPRESHYSKPCSTVYIRLGSEKEALLAAGCLDDRCRPSAGQGSASQRFQAEVVGLATSSWESSKVSNKKVRFEDDRCRVLLFPDGESVEYLSLRLDKEPLSLSLGREKSQKTQIRVRLRVL
eukprot:s3186_g1.t1